MYYTTYASKARGVSHRAKNLPNQDWYKIQVLDDALLIAVADGHGSSECPFSKDGARIATSVFCDVVKDIFKTSPNINSFCEEIKELKSKDLPLKIIECCNVRVIKDFQQTKLIGDDSGLMGSINPEKFKEIYVKYGTTLLGLVVADDFYFGIQIGDGDILSAFEDGSTQHVLESEVILGVETHSLSSEDAASHFVSRLEIPSRLEDMPVLFTLSTDGLSNSYVDKHAFDMVAEFYLDELKNRKLDNRKLNRTINLITSLGSGDDITLVIAGNLKRISGEN
jgi:serine/threonine protein phosphatase PrpC